MSSQILETYAASLTTYLPAQASLSQDVAPQAIQRGVNLDGSLREAPGFAAAIAGNPLEAGHTAMSAAGGSCGGGGCGGGGHSAGGGSMVAWNRNNRICGDVRLDTGTYAPFDIDIAMPATGFSWMIGRTYNSRQDVDTSHHDSDGYQGRNWFQTSQPEILLYDDPSDAAKDVIYLIYGADRYVEFKRVDDSSDQFKGKNGAAGVVEYQAPGGINEPETYVYTDQHGTRTTFFGFDANAGIAKGQIWKIADAAGNTAYVGHETTPSTAISSGYEAMTGSGGGIKLAYDTDGRRYTYTYTTLDSVKRLTSVSAEFDTGSGWVEVNRVDYAYYTSADTTYGEAGNLKLVTITTPLTDSSNDQIRKKYYRYHKSGDTDGTSYQVKLVVDFEGTRNYDWTQDQAFDDDFLTASQSALMDYAAAYFEYSSRKIDLATFNGQRACSGIATGEGTYEFTYSTNGSHSGGSGYDSDWLYRTIVELPDTHFLTQYFDEVGQPLGQVKTKLDPSQTSGQRTWATQVIRDNNGCITSINTPANVSAYTHSTGAFTLEGSVGLVTAFTRQSSGDLTGFITDIKHKTGTSGDAYLDLTLTYTTSSKTLTDATVVRPFVASRRVYEEEQTSGTTNSNLTSMSYTFYTSAAVLMPKEITTTYPAVTTAKNGSNSSNTSKQFFLEDGTLQFAKNPEARIDYTEYDGGQLVEQIIDADTTSGDFSGITIPTGFASTGSPLHRKTTFTYDRQGRSDQTNASDAGGLIKKRNYSILASRLNVVLAYNNFESNGTDTFYGPVQYSITNQAGRSAYQCVIELTDNDSTTALNSHVDITKSDVIDAVANLGNCFILSKTLYNETGTQVEAQHQYHTRPPVPGSGAPTGEGSAGTNYDVTTYAYDAMGRRIRSVTPAETISRTNYDEIGRATSNEIGTNDNGDPGGDTSGTNNMVTVGETIYDGGSDGGNSYVTKTTAYVQDSATNKRETTFAHDVRGRVLLTTFPAEPKFTLNKYDNLGRIIASAMYKDSGGGTVSASDNPITRSTDRLSLNRSYFDEMGRTWKTTRHEINTSSGADDDSLSSLTWYDKVGRVMKSQGEQLTKTYHDRLGRVTHQFTLASTDDSSYADAQTVTGDIVLEEHQTVHDPDGNEVLMQVVIQRKHNDYGMGETTGPLDTNADNDPMKITASDLKGRAQITSMWYDDLHRLTDTVMYGTNGGSTFDRTSLAIPARSDTALRTTYTYDLRGRTDEVEDPKGHVTKSEYDDANRQLKVIKNYDPNTNSGLPSGTDVNQTVEYVYEDGLRTKVIAVMPNSLDNQETVYSYGVEKGTSAGESKIASKDLLHTTMYPDSANGNDVVTYAYNAQSQMIWTKDQVGRVMEYTYDVRGRRTLERVTTLGGFDGYVRRIQTSFDTWGRVSLVTSYDTVNPDINEVVRNQVKQQYDGWGNLIEFDQNPTGSVPGSTSDYAVQYTYGKNEPTGARHTIRRTKMFLPHGNELRYNYSSTGGLHDDEASRVTEIAEFIDPNAVVRVTYRYLGVGHLVGTTYDQPGLNSHLYDGSDDYDALDRFNRTTISRWTKPSQSDRYSVTLTYDRNSNITTLDDSVQTGFDWKYTYDALDRLTDAQAGTLSMGSITSETRQQVWNLDHAGNWTHTDLEENDTTTIFDWDFTHNPVNEITGWDNQTDNVVPAYDAAGNMTDDKRDWKYEYDAWYRLVKVKDQSDDVKAEFRYNGLGFRVSARYDETAPWLHFAYDERWRIVAMFEASDTDPTEQFWYQNAGDSGRGSSSYIDDVVLRDRDTDGNGSLDERRYYCQNWHHDVMVICDTFGSVSERANYDTYGTPIGAFSTIGNRKGYTGFEYDLEIGQTYHVRNRVYKPTLGRWTRRDPAGYTTILNLYAYSNAQPTIFFDPMGLCIMRTDTDKGASTFDSFLEYDSNCADIKQRCDGAEPNAWVKDAKKYAHESCSRCWSPCPTWKVSCPQDTGSPGGGNTNCETCTITIRPSEIDGKEDCYTLAHELVHAGDLCENGRCNPSGVFPSCIEFLCSEYRGYAIQCCASHPGQAEACHAMEIGLWQRRKRREGSACVQLADRTPGVWAALKQCCGIESFGGCDSIKDTGITPFEDAINCLHKNITIPDDGGAGQGAAIARAAASI